MKMQYNPQTESLELNADYEARRAALAEEEIRDAREEEARQAERAKWMKGAVILDAGQRFVPPQPVGRYVPIGAASQTEGGAHATKWDWWQATINIESWGSVNRDTGDYVEAIDNFLDWLWGKMPFSDRKTSNGGTGYNWLTTFKQGDNTVCQVLHGGKNTDPNIKSSGANAEMVRAWVIEMFPDGRVSRMDSAVDSMSGTAEFQAAAEWLEKRAEKAGINCRWITNSDSTKGNTLYVGSQNSRVMIRLYEKGKQMGYRAGDWWRAEIQLRPDSKSKEWAYAYQSSMCWAATRVSREFYEMIAGKKLAEIGFQSPKQVKTLDVRTAHLVRQYGRLLKELAEEEGGALAAWSYIERIAEEIGVGRLLEPEAGERG